MASLDSDVIQIEKVPNCELFCFIAFLVATGIIVRNGNCQVMNLATRDARAVGST